MKDATKQKIEGQWDQLRGDIKQSWGKLTDDDLKRVEGSYDKLVGVIEEKTGESRQKIENRLDQITESRFEGRGAQGAQGRR